MASLQSSVLFGLGGQRGQRVLTDQSSQSNQSLPRKAQHGAGGPSGSKSYGENASSNGRKRTRAAANSAHRNKTTAPLKAKKESPQQAADATSGLGLSSPNSQVRCVARDLNSMLESSQYTPDILNDRPFPCNAILSDFTRLDTLKVFDDMIAKELRWVHTLNLLSQHPELQPRMRTILIEWLAEVAEVYKLQRETFYLAIEYLDRFLSQTANIPKAKLQLVGISCLFTASKVEEIYPPVVSKLAYVTDGACTQEDIVAQELEIASKLSWDMYPATVNTFMEFLLQLYAHISEENDENSGFTPTKSGRKRMRHSYPFSPDRRAGKREISALKPNYSPRLHRQVSQVLDLAIQDLTSRQFKNSTLVAASIFHFTDEETVNLLTGFELKELGPCITFLAGYVDQVRESMSDGQSESSSQVDSAVGQSCE